VYRLSLVFGVSYSAAAYHLASLDKIPRARAEELVRVRPKDIKQAILGDETLLDPWADVWHLSKQDDGQTLFPRGGDHLVIDLPCRASGGYLWQLENPGDLGPILSITGSTGPQREETNLESRIGSSLPQRFGFLVGGEGQKEILLAQRRPWEDGGEPLTRFKVKVAVTKKPDVGLAPEQRPIAA